VLNCKFEKKKEYGLTYPIPHRDHLVRRIESTNKVAQRDAPSACVVLEEEINEIVSYIVHLNDKIVSLEEGISMIKNLCQQIEQVFYCALNVKAMVMKLINVLIGMQLS